MPVLLVSLIFLLAALLEVGGDALVRHGLKTQAAWLVLAGCLVLGGYGILVNKVPWDFSRLLGVYVAVFALVSILAGRFLFQEAVPASTWAGLGLIVLGGLTIQFGPR